MDAARPGSHDTHATDDEHARDASARPACEPLDGVVGYVAPADAVDALRDELVATGDARGVLAVHGRLVLARGPVRPVAWAQDVWLAPARLRFASIGEAARALTAVQRNWSHLPLACHRRAALLVERLPHVGARPLAFGVDPPRAPLGAFTLLDEHELLASAARRSAFAHGEPRFVENRVDPPSRAYLKLWEALTRLGTRPAPGARCVDLGASPGGWTWVLLGLGARVLAVDRAPLDARLAGHAGLEVRQESAFGLDPRAVGPVDWLFSDVICYPDRLLDLVRRWLDAGTCPRLLCTVKLQGRGRPPELDALASLPGSRLVHLHHNRHELTFVHLPRAEWTLGEYALDGPSAG